MRRLSAVLLALIFLLVAFLAACRSDENPAAPPAPPGSAGADEPSPDVPLPRFAPHERWGAGRGLAAAVHDGTQRLAVATSAGVALYEPGSQEPFNPGALDDRIQHVAFSADGQFLAFVTAAEPTLHVWDVSRPAPVLEESLPAGAQLFTITFWPGPGNKPGVLVGTPASLTHYPLDGAVPQTLMAPTPPARLGPPAMTPDDTYLVVPLHGAAGDEIHLWQPGAAVAQQVLPLPGRAETLFAVAAPGGAHIAVARVPAENPLEGEIQLWDVADGALVGTVTAPGAVEQGTWSFTAGGERLLIATGDGEVTVWDTATMAQMGAVSLSSPYPLRALLGEADGFLAVHANGVLQRFDGTGEVLSRTDPLDGTIIAADRSTGAATLALVDFDGGVHLLRVADLGQVRSYEAHASGEINALSFAPDGAGLALATSTGQVRFRPVDGAGAPVAFDRPGLNVDSVAVSPDGAGLALGVGERLGATAFDDTVQVWGLEAGRLRLDLGGDGEEVLGCAFFRNRVRFAPAGDLLALNSHDFTVSLWQVADGRLLHTFPPHASSVLDLAFSPDGSLLATSSDDSTLRLWRTDDFRLLSEQTVQPGGYWSLAFSPDGRWLAASTLSGEILLLDPASGAVRRTLSGGKSRYSDLVFSPDGRLLAAGDDENQVVLWSVSDGAVHQRLSGHSGPVVAVAFSPDGRVLASGSRDYTVRLWSVGE